MSRSPAASCARALVENQIACSLTTTMMRASGVRTVRGYGFFGDSFGYVIFEDGTDDHTS